MEFEKNTIAKLFLKALKNLPRRQRHVDDCFMNGPTTRDRMSICIDFQMASMMEYLQKHDPQSNDEAVFDLDALFPLIYPFMEKLSKLLTKPYEASNVVSMNEEASSTKILRFVGTVFMEIFGIHDANAGEISRPRVTFSNLDGETQEPVILIEADELQNLANVQQEIAAVVIELLETLQLNLEGEALEAFVAHVVEMYYPPLNP